MTTHIAEWKQRAELAFAPLRSIDRSWFPDALRQHTKLLDVSMLGATTRRLLYTYVPKVDAKMFSGEIAVPGWAQLDHIAIRRMVLRLGAFACATPLRLTIEQSQLADVRRAIDDETYRDAVIQATPLIHNDISADYQQALQAGNIQHFVAAMGMSVLQQIAPQDEFFIEFRLRYHFSSKAWQLRQSELSCDSGRAIEILNQVGNV